MKIKSLPSETIDNLAVILAKDSTIGWKKLMMKGFCDIYSQQEVLEIEQKPFPAIALLNDLAHREESVENLVKALEKIGNLQAISIINKGQMKDGRNHQDGVAWPPSESVEHPRSDLPTSVEQGEVEQGEEEQAETSDLLLLPYPIQESGGHERHSDEMEWE